jgi:catechol 2,3-dioxygenase-like lactoylglutathione lyase family enzyme
MRQNSTVTASSMRASRRVWLSRVIPYAFARADYDGPFYVLRRIHVIPIQEATRGFRGKERSMQIEGLDHLVLTVADVGRTRDFYERVLGMEPVVFGEGRHALAFGAQKINLHEAGREFEPKAAVPTPGSADLCFLTDAPVAEVVEHLAANGVEILEGPVRRTGAAGPVTSVYFRDPDGNLIEVSGRLGA